MKNTHFLKLSSLLIVFLCSFQSLIAQDIIKRIDGKKIECKIVNLSDEQVSYEPYGVENPPVINIDMSLVEKVTFENGYEYVKEELEEVEIYRYEETHRNALKADLIASVGTSTHFSYERLLNHRRSIEYGLLIHGLGFNNSRYNAAGVGFEVGFKFISGSTSILGGSDTKNALNGWYIKPELMLGFIGYDYSTRTIYIPQTGEYIEETERLNEIYGGIYLNAGYQVAVDGVFIVDFYAGIGPAFYGEKHKEISYTGPDSPPSVTGHTLPVGGGVWVNDANISIKGGIKIGFAFGDKLNAREINKKR